MALCLLRQLNNPKKVDDTIFDFYPPKNSSSTAFKRAKSRVTDNSNKMLSRRCKVFIVSQLLFYHSRIVLVVFNTLNAEHK